MLLPVQLHRLVKSKAHEPRRKALIIAVAFCKDGRTLIAQNGTDVKQNPEIHAEARLIKRAFKLYTTIDTLYVFRFTRTGMMDNACPCNRCAKKIKKHSIRWVYYSGKDSNIHRF